MSLRIYVRDRKGNVVNQPDLDTAVGLRYASLWPKGHSVASFTVNRDIARQWHIKQAYDVQIKDGHKTVYQGLINNLRASISGLGQKSDIECLGYYSLLSQRSMRKRWIDNSPFDHVIWPAASLSDESQNRLPARIQNSVSTLTLPDQFDGTNGDDFKWEYTTPSGNFIKRVTYGVYFASDDGIDIILQNPNGSPTDERTDSESSGSPTVVTPAPDVTISNGDTSVIRWDYKLSATDTDYNMFALIFSPVVYVHYTASHPDYGTESYYADEIIIDCLIKEIPEISQDYSDFVSPSLELLPFATKDDLHEPIDSIVQRATNFGDVRFNSYGFSVWDSDGSTDGLPKGELKTRPPLDDWDYEVSIDDLVQFTYEPSLDRLHNYLHIRYTDSLGNLDYLSAEDTAALKDSVSIDTYGRRDKVLGLGKGKSTVAQSYGERWLELHKDPLAKIRLTYDKRTIRRKDGSPMPTAWLRAGCRVKIVDYEGGLVFLVRRADHDAEAGSLRLESDIPPDGLDQFTAQQTLGLEVVTPREPRV